MPADPSNNDNYMPLYCKRSVHIPSIGSQACISRENKKLPIDHDVFEWVDSPDRAQLIPSRMPYKWRYNQDGAAFRLKTRVVVQGSREYDTGTDKAAPVDTLESVHLVIANAAKNDPARKQVGCKSASYDARIPPTAEPVYIVSPAKFECADGRAKQVWRMQARLYGLNLPSCGW